MGNTSGKSAGPAVPDSSILENWKVKNNSPAFDENAASRYLARTEGAFATSVGRIMDSVLSVKDPSKAE